MDTKFCPTCKTDKPLDEFSWRSKPKNQRAPHCKVCYAAKRRETYQRNKAQIIAKNYERTKNTYAKYKQWKETLSCSLCPEDDECTIELHHLDPSKKDFNVSELAWRGAWKKLMEEVDKCIVVCGNCHTKIHKYGLEEYKRACGV